MTTYTIKPLEWTVECGGGYTCMTDIGLFSIELGALGWSWQLFDIGDTFSGSKTGGTHRYSADCKTEATKCWLDHVQKYLTPEEPDVSTDLLK